jgi:hypothetical protein
MKIDSESIKNANLNELLDYKISIVGPSNRQKTNKEFMGKPNCSGVNINEHLVNGMTVAQYQAMIRNHFHSGDPQFCVTKHLKYDIEHGHLELVK